MLSRYEALLAALDAGVVIHAADTAIVEANDRARALLGLQDLEGRLATDPEWVFLESDHSPMALERFPVMQVLATQQAVRGLIMIIRPPMSPDVWMEVNALPIIDDSGQLEQVIVTFIDVSDRERAVAELAQSAGYSRSLIEVSLDPLVTISAAGVITDVNAATEIVTGVPREGLIGSDFAGYFTDPELARDGYLQAFAAGSVTDYPLAIRHADGTVSEVLYNATVYRDQRGEVAGVLAAARDITDRARAERALATSEELLRVVLDTSRDVTIQIGRDGRIEYVNRRAVEVSGTPLDQWIGKTFQEMGYASDLAESWEAHRRKVFTTGEPVTYEFEMVNAEGHRWYETTVAPGFDSDGAVAHVIETSRDFTERKNASDALQVMTTHDPLTGLANRSAVIDEITRAMSGARRSGRTTAVLMMDLDRFKDVNDTMGHAAGDELLIAAAARVEHVVRAGDLVARLGGDEFVVAMRDLDDPAVAGQVASRLVEAFQTPFTVAGAELYTTASVGVAFATDVGNAGDLLREADTAMYAAKESGRDRVAVFNEDLRTAITKHLAVEGDLRHALERHQLAVWYQPEVDLTSGAVIAVEALMRWHHPDGSIWSADQFIDVAEDTGLILDIGNWALHEACREGAAWAAGRPDRHLTVRINESALQIGETGLLPTIDDALAASGLDPGRLCIEITETALLRRTATALDNLAGIHERGIGIAIDDFGTGYGSLTYLNHYPIDVIKIDRSFITDSVLLDHDHRLVAGIIALARILDITVTAEGVEQPDQATRLRRMGCPSAQGFLYSPAVPADQLTPLLDHAYPCY